MIFNVLNLFKFFPFLFICENDFPMEKTSTNENGNFPFYCPNIPASKIQEYTTKVLEHSTARQKET